METERLLERAQSGDTSAVDQLLRTHYSAIHSVCHRMLLSRESADDAVQNALIAIVKGLPRFDGKAALSTWIYRIATNSAIDEIRAEIMPFSKSFPLKELRESLEYWYQKTKSKITYEYVVWKGINDDQKSIDALVKFCKYVPCKVNLIEYNPIDDGQFQQASQKAIEDYIFALERNDIVVKVRRSRGKDIDAACGQLANKEA